MTHRYWPLFDLSLASADLTLRPMAEADLTAIADLLPDDVEQDPAAMTYAIGDDRISRGIVSHQHYWKAYGTWRPGASRLNFVVSAAGHIIGVQELEATTFLSCARSTLPLTWFPRRGAAVTAGRCGARCSRWPSGP